ncbi:type IV pilus biogenesis protein PilM [Desulfonatronum thiodismutans]|uniref:hypothetical protein n=1 Tax=Desulfonatronum thiodismutans TaxID=159290 RepID=UPI0004ABE25D|nr:hypothetical protein [Desulfonatronum thiodismutans]
MSQATEKLLHVITGQSKTKALPSRKKAFSSVFSLKKRKGRFLGVDLEARGLRMVLTGGEDNVFLASRHTSYPQGLTPRDSGFPAFLREEAASLCGQFNDLIVWSHVASSRFEVIPLKMPTIPLWEMGEMIPWRVRKDHPFDDEEFVLDFEIQGKVQDQGVPKVAVLACLAPRADISRMRGIFSAAGLPLAGLTVAPLAFQGMFQSRCCDVPESTFALLDISDRSTRIDLYTQRRILLSRVIKTGMTSMAEALATVCTSEKRSVAPTAVRESSSDNDDVEIIIRLDDFDQDISTRADTESGENATSDLADALPENPAQPLNDQAALDLLLHKMAEAPPPQAACPPVTSEDVFRMITPVCERLARQVERTFDYTVRTLGYPRPEQVVLTGTLSSNQALLGYLSSELGAPVRSLGALGADSALHSDVAAMLPPYEVRGLDLAAALTRCEQHGSINLLKTFLQRQTAKAVEHANMAVYAATILVLLILSLLYGLEQATAREKARTLQQLDERLTAFHPQVDETMLLRLAADLGRERTRIANLSDNLKPVALLGEVSRLTPDYIRILHLRLDPAPANNAPDKSSPKDSSSPQSTTITLDLLVTGPFDGLNTALSEYLFTLRNSPLFDVPLIHGKTIEHHPGVGQAMRVTLHLSAPRG